MVDTRLQEWGRKEISFKYRRDRGEAKGAGPGRLGRRPQLIDAAALQRHRRLLLFKRRPSRRSKSKSSASRVGHIRRPTSPFTARFPQSHTHAILPVGCCCCSTTAIITTLRSHSLKSYFPTFGKKIFKKSKDHLIQRRDAGKNSNNLVGDLHCWRQLHGVGDGGRSPGPPRRLQFPRRPRHYAPGVRLPLVGEFPTSRARSAQPDGQAAVDQHVGRSGRPPPPRPSIGQQSQEGDRVTLHPAHPQRVLSQRRLPASIQILPLERSATSSQVEERS